MKKVAFLFTQGPHTTSSGREGLDALLATSALTDEIGVFFIGDGVFQLLSSQQPEKILARDYIATYGVLPLYDIDKCYLCASSAESWGLSDYADWVLSVEKLTPEMLRQLLASYDAVMTF